MAEIEKKKLNNTKFNRLQITKPQKNKRIKTIEKMHNNNKKERRIGQFKKTKNY